MKRNYVAIGIILLFLGSSIIPAIAQETEKSQSTSEGNWLYVGGSGLGNYSRIQDAIDNASDDDTVFVYSGIYNENLVVNKSIILMGQEKTTTVLLGANGSTIVEINKCSVQFKGFTIQKYDETNFAGILLNGCESSRIHDNVVMSCSIGMMIGDTGSTIISHNTILNCTDGILMALIANVTVTQNRIEGDRKGCGINLFIVMLGMLYKNYITKNSIMNNSIGLNLYRGWSMVIQENNFIGNQQHAFFISSFSNKWEENYWNLSSSRPQIIPGQIGGMFVRIKIPLINVDWHPASEPYDIPGMN